MGIIEVDQGDMVPGLGRVEAIRKQDGRWVVVTSKGLIVAAEIGRRISGAVWLTRRLRASAFPFATAPSCILSHACAPRSAVSNSMADFALRTAFGSFARD